MLAADEVRGMRWSYHNRVLHVDLSSGRTWVEEPQGEFFRLYAGGGLLATVHLLRETPPGIDPLGPENLLIFASSVVAGHPAPGLPRFAVAAKSPLTGGIGEARAEGPWGIALKASGVDTIGDRLRDVDQAADPELGPATAEGRQRAQDDPQRETERRRREGDDCRSFGQARQL